MADRIELSGESELRGRNGWSKIALVVRRPGSEGTVENPIVGELRFDFFSKTIGNTAPVILALSPADRVALGRFLLDASPWPQRYSDWLTDRERISEQEAGGNYPPADDWHGSDDRAVELLQEAAYFLGCD